MANWHETARLDVHCINEKLYNRCCNSTESLLDDSLRAQGFVYPMPLLLRAVMRGFADDVMCL